MKMMEQESSERGPQGRAGCGGGGSSHCGCHNEHDSTPERADEAATLRTSLEDRQRDLEQELATVAQELRDLEPNKS